MHYIQTLTRYKAWATDLMFAAMSRLPEHEIIAPRPIVFGSMIRTLNHVYAMDQVWQAHLEGRSHGFITRNPDVCPPLGELRDLQQRMNEWYVGYAHSLTETAYDEVVSFEFIGGGAGSMSRGEILLHVVNHTTYHRGHIADMMYQIGAQPPTSDFPVFLRDHRDGA